MKESEGSSALVALIVLAISSALAASIGSTVLKLVEETLPSESVSVIITHSNSSVEILNTEQLGIDLNSLGIYINGEKARISDENKNGIWEPNEKIIIDLDELEDVSVVQIIYDNQVVYKAIYIKPLKIFSDLAFPEISYNKSPEGYRVSISDDISIIAVNIYTGYESGEKLAFGFSPVSANDEKKLMECYDEYRKTGKWQCEVPTAEFSLSWVKEGNNSTLIMNYGDHSYTSLSNEPAYFARVEASDITGKLSSIVLALDSPPSVTLTSPPDGAEYVTAAPMSITVSASAKDDFGIAKIELYLDGNLLKVCERTESCSADVNVAVGDHVAMAIAYDIENQMATDTANFRIAQDLPPSVSIQQPTNGTRMTARESDFNATVEINASASDDFGLRLVEVYLDNVKIQSYSLSGQREFSFSFDYSAGVGEHRLEVFAYDIGGKNSSASVSFTVIPPPYVRITSVYVPEVDWRNSLPTNVTQPVR